MLSVQQIVLLDLLLLAAYFDLTTGKIPNWLCFGGSMCALFHAVMSGSAVYVAESLLGGVWPILLLGLLFRLRVMGAGDIKLLAMVGLWAGNRSIACIGASILWSGIFAGGKMLVEKRWISRIGMAPAILAGYVTIMGGGMGFA